jgi:hypothetical protein
MTLSANERELVEAFLGYVEDSVTVDDRYGTGSRYDRPDGSFLSIRFHAGGPCWFELAVLPAMSEVRAGFLTDDAVTNDGMAELIADSGQSLSQFVGAGFFDAGLDWPEPPVDRTEEQASFRFTTPLKIDGLSDLDLDDVRDKALRMLEGYLIAFGPALAIEEELDEATDFEEDDDEAA